MTRFLGGVLLVVAVSSCRLPGAPIVGSACEYGMDLPECMTDTSLGYCTTYSKWEEVNCDSKCSNSNSPPCDIKAGPDGSSCPQGATAGHCASADTASVCSDGAWKTQPCTGCQERNGVIGCY